MKATALPTPSGVLSASWNVNPNLLVVSSQRWIAAVQMTRIRVRTYASGSGIALRAKGAESTYAGK